MAVSLTKEIGSGFSRFRYLRTGFGATALILPGWLVQDASVLNGDALAGLILAGTATFLIFSRLTRSVISGGIRAWDRVTALSLMALGTLVAFSASFAGDDRLPLAFAAMALLALGITCALGGRARLAELAAPILVLYLIVPMIPLLEAALSYPLRHLSAMIAYLLLSIGPASAALRGTEIYYGDLTVSVTSACDGLTLLQNLVWIAWWTVLLRHRGFLNRLAHGLIAMPAAIIANSLRILVLALWASAQGPEVLASPGHLYISQIAVGIGAALFFAMESIFPRTRSLAASDATDS